MNTKPCAKCKIMLSIDNFHKNPTQRDGFDHYCKKCRKIMNQKSISKHRDRIVAYRKAYAISNKEKISNKWKDYYNTHKSKLNENYRKYYLEHKDSIKNTMQKWLDKHPGYRSNQTSKFRSNNPEKYKSHIIVFHSLVNGIISKSPCSKCGATTNIHAHHNDYSKPLEITWLCASCHRKYHTNCLPN